MSLPSVTTETLETPVTNATTPYWSLPFSTTLATILAIIFILSFFGNMLVLAVVLRFKNMRTRTNLFIANLAVADFLTTILCMPVSFTTIITGDWIFGDVVCQITGFLMPLLFITSIHTLMYISLHKYFTITNPFKTILTRPRVIMMIGASWLVSLTLAVVDIYALNSVEYKPYTSQCGPKYPNGIKGYLHNAVMTLTTYIIPVAVMVFSYSKMFREIVAYSKRMEKHTSMEKNTILNTQKKAAFTLLIVVVCFILCWTPYLIYATYGSAVREKSYIPHWANPMGYWFGYLNSACNPIIYGLRNKSFSSGYKSILCCASGGTNSGIDDGSRVFNTWPRKRSSTDDGKPAGESHRKLSQKQTDPTLPVAIRKNGKIIRIEEAATKPKIRSATMPNCIPSHDVTANCPEVKERDEKQNNTLNGGGSVDDQVLIPQMPTLTLNRELAALDSCSDNDFVSSDISSKNTLLERSHSDRSWNKNDGAVSFVLANNSNLTAEPETINLSRSMEAIQTKRHGKRYFKSLRKRNHSDSNSQSDQSLKLDFWSMDQHSFDVRHSACANDTSLPIDDALAENTIIVSLPSLDDLQCDVITSAHVKHSTPKHPDWAKRFSLRSVRRSRRTESDELEI